MTGHDLLPIALLLLVAGFAVLATFRRESAPTDWREPRDPERRPDPPTGVPVLVAAHVVGWRRRSTSAQLADLVGRGLLRVVPGDVAQVEVVDLTGAAPVERAFVAALVGHEQPRRGDRAVLSGSDAARDGRLREVQSAVNALVLEDGWRYVPPRAPGASGRRVALVTVALLSLPLLGGGFVTAWVPAFLVLLVVVELPRQRVPHLLTNRGVTLRDHLLGVREHLRRDPLPDAPPDPAVRAAMLPWAVLFGHVPSWRRRGAGAPDGDLTDLLDLLQRLGVVRDASGSGPEQDGDRWADVATGGSRARYDGAFVPRLD